MKGLSYSSSEDEDFNGGGSDEEDDYGFVNEQESLQIKNEDVNIQNDKIPSSVELSEKTIKNTFDISDGSESDNEDFKINSESESESENEDFKIGSKSEPIKKDINTSKETEIEPDMKSPQMNQDEANNILSKGIASDTDSDDDDFEENTSKNSYQKSESSEFESDYSDIEFLKKKKESEQKNDLNNLEKLKTLFNAIITLIPPYKTASEALSNSISDDQKAQQITDIATQLLFLGKYNIYSCDIEQLKNELSILQKSV